MKSRILLLVAVTTACTAFGAEKRMMPKDLPPYGPLKAYVPPEVTQEKLSNGLTVWLVPRMGFPKVAFEIAVRGGMAADPADRPGLAEFLMATVNEGTKTRTARQIAEQLQGAGGDWTGQARADALMVATSALAPKAEDALAVLADVMQNATFPENEVELARRNLSDSLRQRESQPRFLGDRALAQAIFGEHPYRVIAPTQPSLAKTTAAELRQEYARRFRPDQALLVVVGNFDAANMRSLVQKLLGAWKAPSSSAVAAVPALAKTPKHEIFAVPRSGSVQTTLLVGQFGPARRDTDYVSSEVADAIFGGMFGSRLVNNIREDKGYTYSPFSFLQMRRQTGLFRTQADVRNQVTGATFNEITYELNRMATTEPTQEELTMAERYLVGNQAITFQSQAALAGELALLWVNDLPPQRLGEESQQILKTTAKDVAMTARKYYPAARVTVVAVGEPKVVQEELSEFGIPIKAAVLPDQPASAKRPAQ